jgi:hypothetical protein
MQPNHNHAEQIHRWSMLVVGTVVVAALGAGAIEYGPQAASSIRDFYHPPKHSRPQASELMMQDVTKFEVNPEMREYLESKSAEFAANKQLGENYRMPPQHRP